MNTPVLANITTRYICHITNTYCNLAKQSQRTACQGMAGAKSDQNRNVAPGVCFLTSAAPTAQALWAIEHLIHENGADAHH